MANLAIPTKPAAYAQAELGFVHRHSHKSRAIPYDCSWTQERFLSEAFAMYTSTAVEILISSPSDVVDARDAIQEEIAQWNTANARRRGVTAVAVRWETHATPEMGDHPQAIQFARGLLK